MVNTTASAHTIGACLLIFGLVFGLDNWQSVRLETATDADKLRFIAASFIALGALTFCALQFLVAPYGRYSSEPIAAAYGFKMDSRLAWVLQEVPCVLWAIWQLREAGGGAAAGQGLTDGLAAGWAALSAPNRVLWSLFLLHYVNRTFVFPFRMRAGKPTPFGVFALALLFCALNGYLQCRALCAPAFQRGDAELDAPHFLVGVILFF